MSWSSFAPAVAEICLAVAICVILLVDVFAGEKRRNLTSTLTLLALAVGAALTVRYGYVTERQVLFDGMYVADELGSVLKLAAFLFVAVALLYSRAYLEDRNILRGEYYVLALTALLGIFVLISANNLLTLYLGVELLALSVYALVAFDRDSGISAESAIDLRRGTKRVVSAKHNLRWRHHLQHRRPIRADGHANSNLLRPPAH